MSPFNVIKHIASRTELKHTGKTKSGQDQYMGKCLAHDDNTASLAVCYTDNGGIGVYCHKGCSEGEICDSLDLKPSDLLPPSRNGNGKPNYEAVYSYVDEQGVELFQKIRKPGKKFSQRRKGNGEWVYKLGDVRKVLYRLDEITKAGANDLVFVVEGEKDADNFRKIGLVATCNPEGAATSNQRQKWRPEYSESLRGKNVVVIPDNDDAGRAHAADVAEKLRGIAATVKAVELPGLAEKGDVSDWLAAGGTKEELLQLVDGTVESEKAAPPISIISITKLVEDNPELDEPIITGLARRGETLNWVAAPKMGKSWGGYGTALSVATGWPLFGKFEVAIGRALIIDNEVRAATLAKRIPDVAKAMGAKPSDYAEYLDILPLRGKGVDLRQLVDILEAVESGHYNLIVADAWYRFIPEGISENDNAQVAQLYNLIDTTTEKLNACWVNIHHSSKGAQGDKRVTDVGAGAGAQSRAADTHVIMRPHEEDGVVVMEAAVRSFAPFEPIALRWEYPLWKLADDVDTKKLKERGTKRQQQLREDDTEKMGMIVDAIETNGPKTASKLRDLTGIGPERIKKLAGILITEKKLGYRETVVRGNPCLEYFKPEDVVDVVQTTLPTT